MTVSSIYGIALISVRLLPLLVVAPIAPLARAPLLVRLVLSISLATIIGLNVPLSGIEQLEVNPLHFLTEFLIGATLAFSIHSAYAALHTMGQLMDMQIGFAAASMLAPGTEQLTTPTAEVLSIALIFVVFMTNVHQDILIGFAKLCEVVPPGSKIVWNKEWITIIGALYTIGLLIASPVIIVLWMIDLTMAFISRSLPQAPIYFVALPAKIGIGLIVLSWFFSQLLEPLIRLFGLAIDSWGDALKV